MKTQFQNWTSFCLYFSISALLIISSCSNDDEAPKLAPSVLTGGVTNITTASASLSGEITDDGNDAITASGFVYSNAVGTPTLADDKLILTITSGALTGTLDGLDSGTMYFVRAYATNSVGTGYGNVVNFMTGNAAPVASNVTISGTVEANLEVTVSYTYNDSEGDAEGVSMYKWYVADDATGTNAAPISGETSSSYTISTDYENKFIAVGITPVATTGNTTGIEVKSPYIGIGEATTVTFTYNGQEVTYGIIVSSTGKRWLDRNLGATGLPTSFEDFQKAGDFFEWGRLADGHQLVVRGAGSITDVTFVNGTVGPFPDARSSSTTPSIHKFIILVGDEPEQDWLNPQNSNLWQGVNGINNPCPSGWRIPTLDEWVAENISNLEDGFTKLKLTKTGFVQPTSATVSAGIAGFWWASTIGTDTKYSKGAFATTTAFFTGDRFRAQGLTCRCVKD